MHIRVLDPAKPASLSDTDRHSTRLTSAAKATHFRSAWLRSANDHSTSTRPLSASINQSQLQLKAWFGRSTLVFERIQPLSGSGCTSLAMESAEAGRVDTSGEFHLPQGRVKDLVARARIVAGRLETAVTDLPLASGTGLCTDSDNTRQAYYSSPMEREWLTWPGGAAGNICTIAMRQQEQAGVWSRFPWRQSESYSNAGAQDSAAAIPGMAPTTYTTLLPVQPTDTEQPLLSRFGEQNFIEPLTGSARHPLWLPRGFDHGSGCFGNASATVQERKSALTWKRANFRASTWDTSYLVLTNHCNERGKPRRPCAIKARNIYYDLGCTTYRGKVSSGLGGYGPSIPLFYQLFERRCIEFDRIFAWEAKEYTPTKWWQDVPISVRSKLHFFNVPVNETADPGDGKPNSNSFLAMLAATAREEDFVALKVDIEGQNGAPELDIVRAIADTPALARLVDELFFEYHFWFDGVDFGWGVMEKESKAGTVDDALRLMHALRERGVRSHFWV